MRPQITQLVASKQCEGGMPIKKRPCRSVFRQNRLLPFKVFLLDFFLTCGKQERTTTIQIMKNKFVMIATVLFGAQLFLTAYADEPQSRPTFKDDKDKASYAIGLNIGTNLKRSHLDINLDVMTEAIKDVLNGRETKLTEAQSREVLTAYQQEMRHRALENNLKQGEAFLATNKKNDGVKIHPVTTPDGTTAELQYKVLTEGTGAMPGSNDTVTVNYRGTLIDGTEFDSSAKRGQPAQFPVTGVIRGWTEALKLMKVGSKWQLFLPASLAYGDRGTPGIEPGSTLIFEVELLNTEPPKQMSQHEPIATSDIIRVPSGEEMKRGAQPEVIKAQDAQKMMMTNGNNTGKSSK
jgi:FKBP-type peptidyl-prolyl cis-trans isomerase FklB